MTIDEKELANTMLRLNHWAMGNVKQAVIIVKTGKYKSLIHWLKRKEAKVIAASIVKHAEIQGDVNIHALLTLLFYYSRFDSKYLSGDNLHLESHKKKAGIAQIAVKEIRRGSIEDRRKKCKDIDYSINLMCKKLKKAAHHIISMGEPPDLENILTIYILGNSIGRTYLETGKTSAVVNEMIAFSKRIEIEKIISSS